MNRKEWSVGKSRPSLPKGSYEGVCIKCGNDMLEGDFSIGKQAMTLDLKTDHTTGMISTKWTDGKKEHICKECNK